MVGPIYAQEKLNLHGYLSKGKFDYLSEDEVQLGQLNSLVEPDGIELVNVKGDCGTRSGHYLTRFHSSGSSNFRKTGKLAVCPIWQIIGKLDKHFSMRWKMILDPS